MPSKNPSDYQQFSDVFLDDVDRATTLSGRMVAAHIEDAAKKQAQRDERAAGERAAARAAAAAAARRAEAKPMSADDVSAVMGFGSLVMFVVGCAVVAAITSLSFWVVLFAGVVILVGYRVYRRGLRSALAGMGYGLVTVIAGGVIGGAVCGGGGYALESIGRHGGHPTPGFGLTSLWIGVALGAALMLLGTVIEFFKPSSE